MPADIGEPQFSRTRRTNGAERVERMLDAKTRLIGVDAKALDIQVAEKEAREAAEISSNGKYVNLAKVLDNQLVILEQERREIERELNGECRHHWATLGQKPYRKEWDLSDPDALKRDVPARIGDADERTGLASMQRYEGEDLMTGERKKMQYAQQRSWWDQQSAEKQDRTAQDAEEDKNYMALNLAQAEQGFRVDAAQEDLRRKEQYRTVEINQRLAEQRKEKAMQEKHDTLSANTTDMYNTFNSALLAEHPSAGVNAFNPNRKRPDHFKGMLPEERQRILDYQAAQRDELKGKMEDAQKENLQYAQSVEDVRKQLCSKAAEMEAFRREQRMQVSNTLKAQQDIKIKRDTVLNKLYTNVPAPGYYDQFGTSHR